MSTYVSDGNGGLYIKRTTVEKALWGLCVIVFGSALTFFGVVAQRSYDTLQRLDRGQIRSADAQEALGKEIKDVAVQASKTEARVSSLEVFVRGGTPVSVPDQR